MISNLVNKKKKIISLIFFIKKILFVHIYCVTIGALYGTLRDLTLTLRNLIELCY